MNKNYLHCNNVWTEWELGGLDDPNIYLAMPYSHDEELVMRRRFEMVSRIAWRFMNNGWATFSPISHSHPIEEVVQDREGHDFWMDQDLTYLREWADAMVVVQAHGWRESDGVQHEIDVAESEGMPIFPFDPLEEMTIVGISGKKRSGKDTMGDVFREYGFSKYALADPMKEIAEDVFLFTDEEVRGDKKETENPIWEMTPRKFLQLLGTEAFQGTFGEEVWTKVLLNRLRLYLPYRAVVTDVRFPHEVEALFDVEGDVIRIEASERLDKDDDHASETALDSWQGFDVRVDNNGSLEEFVTKCHQIAKNYI